MQIAWKFDPVTVQKIKRSAMISFGGFIAVAVPTILPDVLAMLKEHPLLALAVGSVAPFLVNLGKEWSKGGAST